MMYRIASHFLLIIITRSSTFSQVFPVTPWSFSSVNNGPWWVHGVSASIVIILRIMLLLSHQKERESGRNRVGERKRKMIINQRYDLGDPELYFSLTRAHKLRKYGFINFSLRPRGVDPGGRGGGQSPPSENIGYWRGKHIVLPPPQ